MTGQHSSLNPSQQKAVEITEGKTLILAGAGSGKTRVITYRMAHLIKNKGVDPSKILGLTFTNKAAKEMRERISRLIPEKAAKKITLCTFHSLCVEILRNEIHRLGYTKNFTIYNPKEQKRLLKRLAHDLLEHEGELPSIDPLVEQFSQIKNRSSVIEDEKLTPFAKELFYRLDDCMKAYNAVDFDNLLCLTLKLFEKEPGVLNRYQERFSYIMIDEYQDTNPIQYKLTELLADKHKNLCVVGDDDQSIYGWRGAEVSHILKFPADHTIKLEQNYRSTPSILNAANALIQNNKDRHGKNLWSNREKGSTIELFHAPTEKEEAQAVVTRLIHFHEKKKIPFHEIAILYRCNSLARPLEIALLEGMYHEHDRYKRGVPYTVFGGTELYERTEIKDTLAYLKTLSNPYDQEALLRIINIPRRGISDKTLGILTQYNREKKIPLWEVITRLNPEHPLYEKLSKQAISGIQSFREIMQTAKEMIENESISSAINWLYDTISYEKAIKEDVKSDKMQNFKKENLEQFLETIEHFEKENPKAELSDFLADNILNDRRQKGGKSYGVNLMTFHSAKGLEFKACFLIGLEDEVLPHEKSVAENSIEEERRLFYVALTRAKEHLTLSMARKRKKHGGEKTCNPSRFLFEIPQDLIALTPWTQVG